MAAAALMEALAATLIFALVALVSEGSLHVPALGEVTIDGGGFGVFAAAVAAVFVVRAAVVVLHDVVLYRLCYGGGARLEEALLRGYLTLPPRELRRRGHSQLVRNVHDTVMTVVEDCLVPSVLALGHVLRTVSIIAVMAATAPVPTMVAGLVFAPLLWLVSRQVRRPARRLGEVVEHSLEASLRTATETLNLAGDIRMVGRSDAFAARYGRIRRDLARAGGVEEVLRGLPRLAAETVLVLFVIGYIVVASTSGQSEAVLPTLGLFAYAALRVLPSLIALVALVHAIAHSGPAVETVLADEPLLHAGARPVDRAGPVPGTLALRGVSVVLPETGRRVLEDVDVVLRRGDVVAVTGPNGAGKSTLLDVLSGALPPDDGTVTVDGEALTESWPSQVAMVPQHVNLLDADVATNITLDLSGTGTADPRLGSVVESVGLGSVVERLGDGRVGEDGRMLSGGERQRVAVARALYREAGVLLVDEGTSALDATVRSAVTELVQVGREQRITVLVTHDAELASSCSRVLRVEGGRVHEWDAAAAGVLPVAGG